MAYTGLGQFIKDLENKEELIRIKAEVSPVLEMAEIADRISKLPDGGKALFFENTDTSFPVLMNSMGSHKRICMALGVDDLDDIADNIKKLVMEISSPRASIIEKLQILPLLKQVSSWMPKTIKGKGKCQEIVLKEPDLSVFPVLQCWPFDGGRFITLPLVHTKDPLTGIRNVGMYRMQIFDKQTTGMHWHKHKVGARHYREYKNLKIKMPVAVALGGDPVYTYAATAPLPDNTDEYMLAGFLRRKKVDLVKCLTQDIEVPADADIIIEGYVDPEEDMRMEGPFGDHTGYYSLVDDYPVFHVTCITHRKDAVYPATIVGIPPQEDAWMAKATERIFITPLQFSVLPELIDMELPFAGVAHNLTIVKIKKDYEGQALKVMNGLWGAGQMMLNKVLIVVDGEVDIRNYSSLVKYILKGFMPVHDVYFSKGPLDVLDHAAAKLGFGGKMGIDATRKTGGEETLFSVKSEPVKENIEARLKEFSGINRVNSSFLVEGLLLISIKKEDKASLNALAGKIFLDHKFETIKVLFIVDEEVDVNDLTMLTWISANNIDPWRDCMIIEGKEDSWGHLVIDGTRKQRGLDDFDREWPNVIVSDDETIRNVDDMWPSLGLGGFISSPSLKYKSLVKQGGAKVNVQNSNRE
jgi:4-hydroxy-3-polyprenylbenzoate decarboxylase